MNPASYGLPFRLNYRIIPLVLTVIGVRTNSAVTREQSQIHGEIRNRQFVRITLLYRLFIHLKSCVMKCYLEGCQFSV